MADDAETKIKTLFTKLQDLIDNQQGSSKRAVRVIDDSTPLYLPISHSISVRSFDAVTI